MSLEGAVSSRYCDVIDYKDMCWTKFGGTTSTTMCACSNEDKCNTAIATTMVSVTTLAIGAVLTLLVKQ